MTHQSIGRSAQPELTAPKAAWVGIALGILLHSLIVIPYFGYTPIWDAYEYLEAYLFLPRSGLTLDQFFYTHNGHPSFGYYWPFWIGQALFPNRLLMVQLINLLFDCLAIVAFGKVTYLAFRDRAEPLDLALLTVAFAISPVFVAYAVNPTMDSGVIAYFLATLWLLQAGRFGWAAVTGFLLIFCKEISIMFDALAVFACVFEFRGRRRLRDMWLLALPFAAFAAFFIYRRIEGLPYSPFAMGYFGGRTPYLSYLPNPFTWDIIMAAVGPFVLEFQWIFTVFILAALIAGIAAKRFTDGTGQGIMAWFHRFNLPLRRFGFLLLGACYIVSRTVPYLNQRYFLPLYPLVLLCFLAALFQLNVRPLLRKGLLTGIIVLLLIANFRTADPVSRALTGTFAFGTHSLLNIEALRDPKSTNKDALVYNLQHTEFGFLLDDAFAALKPTDKTVLVHDADSWLVWERIDARTYHRIDSQVEPSIRLTHFTPYDICQMKSRPPQLLVVEFPCFHNVANEAELERYYQPTRRLTFAREGYAISVLEMTGKPAPAASSLPSPHVSSVTLR